MSSSSESIPNPASFQLATDILLHQLRPELNARFKEGMEPTHKLGWALNDELWPALRLFLRRWVPNQDQISNRLKHM